MAYSYSLERNSFSLSKFFCLCIFFFGCGLAQAATLDFIEGGESPVNYVIIGIDIPVVIPVPSEKLPKEPEATESFATLEGIDSDADGVRDDIERWIGFKFPTNPAARQVLYQIVEGLQAAITFKNVNSAEANQKIVAAFQCTEKNLALIGGKDTVIDLFANYMNTIERSKAYITM